MSAEREKAMMRIRELRARIDSDVLEIAERMARHHMGFPQKESQAVRLLEKARAEGGRYRAQVLAELERRLKR
jgi:hypothetical protein